MSLEDPWAVYRIEDLPTEPCIRHRYNAYRQKWVQDEVQVKMQAEVRHKITSQKPKLQQEFFISSRSLVVRFGSVFD